MKGNKIKLLYFQREDTNWNLRGNKFNLGERAIFEQKRNKGCLWRFYEMFLMFLLLLTGQLAAQHKERVKKHEEQQAAMKRERQSAFGQAFQEEMDQYKKSGHIPSEWELYFM